MNKLIVNFYNKLLEISKNRKIIKLTAVLLISFSLIVMFLISIKGINNLNFQRISYLSYQYILLSILLYPLGMIPTAIAWHYTIKSLDVNLPFLTNLKIYLLTLFPRHLPGFVFFLGSRTLLYDEIGISKVKIISATFLESVLLAITGLVITLMFPVLGIQYGQINNIGLYIIVVISVVIIGVYLVRKISKNQNVEVLNSIKKINFSKLFIAACWMMIAWCGGGILLFILAKSLVVVEAKNVVLIIVMWGLSGSIGIIIGFGIQGLGIREITLGSLLSLIFPPMISFSLAIGFRLVLIIGEVLWTSVFYFYNFLLKRAKIN